VDKIIIGTRGSQLALWQANFMQRRLADITHIPVELKIIKTQGDKITHLSFDKMEGKGFFTKEIEEALLARSIDLAVHSLKDLMTTMPDGLALTAVGFREDNREAILVRPESFDDSTPLGVKSDGIVGSSSVRRQCQIRHYYPRATLKDLRGNVPTRVGKLRDGEYDAIILAHAGLKRLEMDLSDLKVIIPDHDVFLPAPGQGILGVQTRQGDSDVNAIISRLDEPIARKQTMLERGLLARFDGGCQLPLGAWSTVENDSMALHAVFGVSGKNDWAGLVRASADGSDVNELVDNVYASLTADASKMTAKMETDR